MKSFFAHAKLGEKEEVNMHATLNFYHLGMEREEGDQYNIPSWHFPQHLHE